VAATCDRIIIIDRGKIVAQESINSLGATGLTTKTELVVQRGSESVVQAIRGVKGVQNVQCLSNGKERIIVESDASEEIMAEIAKVTVATNAGLIRMSPVQLALEDYYLNLISGKRGISI
jgi:ABC-2 type transport system ATP-binding protein